MPHFLANCGQVMSAVMAKGPPASLEARSIFGRGWFFVYDGATPLSRPFEEHSSAA